MRSENNLKVDKQHFLEKTNRGFDFYKLAIPDLEMINDSRCENVRNPFYNDTKPSLSIFCFNDIWRSKDHGESGYDGDVFVFAGHYFDMDPKENFGPLLHKMYEALGIEKLSATLTMD